MLEHLRRNGVAYAALFVALSGTSYAAVNLPAHSVGAKQLRTHAVTRSKLAKGAVTKAALAHGVAVSGPAGPKGDQGPRGIQGITGAPGPTQGFAEAGVAGAVPSTTPDVMLEHTTFEATAAGKLLVFARGSYREGCTTPTEVKLGLYVDDQPVAASGAPIASSTNAEVSIWGVTDPVDAGPHDLAVKGDCEGADFNAGSSGGDAAIGAVLLGG